MTIGQFLHKNGRVNSAAVQARIKLLERDLASDFSPKRNDYAMNWIYRKYRSRRKKRLPHLHFID